MSQVDSYDQIPTEVLLPAFLVSELRGRIHDWLSYLTAVSCS